MTKGFGFEKGLPHAKAEEKNVEIQIVIGDIDTEFKNMMQALNADEQLLAIQQHIEEDIRKELVILHKKSQQLIEEAELRNTIFRRCEAKMETTPAEAEELLERVAKIDEDLQVRIKALLQEIDGHVLREVAKIYQTKKLNEKQRVHIAETAKTIKGNLLEKARAVIASNPQTINHYKKQIKQNIEAKALREKEKSD